MKGAHMRTERTQLLVLNLFLTTALFAIAAPKATCTGTPDLTAAVRYGEVMLERMQPVLASAGGASRLYYSTPCKYPEHLVEFPKLRLRSRPSRKTGVAAVQNLFDHNKNVKVSSSPTGIVRISVGNTSTDLLNTRISLLSFNSHEQYNPIAAIHAIERNESFKEAARKLGLEQPAATFSYNTVYPTPSTPHLPATLRNVTLDEALDAVAHTFKALVIYGECVGQSSPRHFTIEFAWIAQY
jgi:hypothetical protein